jgi:sec-independent protein translocase protein TatB
MFDISWTEFLLIGIVALIVIGPKELPAVMRTMGHWTRKIRSLAADFQNQFHEAMREAEMADLKKQVDDMAQDVKHYDPLKDVRADVEAIGKNLDADLTKSSDKTPSQESNNDASKDASTAPESPAAVPDKELPIAAEAAAGLRDTDVVAAGVAPVTPEGGADSTSPDGAGKPR